MSPSGRSAIVAGFAAERLEFGFVSTGVHDDLHAATGLARQMVTSYGMSRALGPVTIGEKAGEVFLGASLLLRGIVVGRGPWGNMFEFTVAFSFSIVTGYLILARRYAISSIGFLPTGVALALLLLFLRQRMQWSETGAAV